MVELCLIFLPLFAIFLGVIDFSVVIFLRGLYQAAVREGVRFAITYNTTYSGVACGTHTQCIQRVVQANTLGFLNGASGAGYIKVNFYSPENLATPLTPAALPVTLSNGNVVRYLNQTGNVVEVRIDNFPWNWITPLTGFWPGRGVTISATAADVLQGYPVGQFAPPTP